MNMLDWARREVEIACKTDDDKKDTAWAYGYACYESALKAFESLLDDGHSGFSISVTKQILVRLIEGKPLTPIEDTDDIWRLYSVAVDLGCTRYQCKRKSSLFKHVYPDGRVEYWDIDRVCCADIDNPNSRYHSGLVNKVIHEMYPIVMPYYPGNSFEVFCKDYLTDRKNGDFDTVAIMYAIEPSGKRIEIKRFFKEYEHNWVEINTSEYLERVRMAVRRQREENNGES